MNTKEKLKAILQERSIRFGDFTLASGAKSDFYVDCRVTALDPQAANYIGEVACELLKEQDLTLDAIGGMTMGADPICLAVGMASLDDEQLETLNVFVVRKEPKGYGAGKQIEGNFKSGQKIVVVDDVITTGGSTLKAVDVIEAAGGEVVLALVLVDREEGGRAAIEARNIPVVSLFTKSDFKI